MGVTKEKLDEFWKSLKFDITNLDLIYVGSLLGLADELLFMTGDIPEELLKKIGIALGKRWLRKYGMDNE